MFDEWFTEFKLTQPSGYFLDHPTDDVELMSSIQTTEEFIIQTLEMFDLPEGYMEGKGHFPDFGKEKDNKGAAVRKKQKAKLKNRKKMNKYQQHLEAVAAAEEPKPPDYFDL